MLINQHCDKLRQKNYQPTNIKVFKKKNAKNDSISGCESSITCKIVESDRSSICVKMRTQSYSFLKFQAVVFIFFLINNQKATQYELTSPIYLTWNNIFQYHSNANRPAEFKKTKKYNVK